MMFKFEIKVNPLLFLFAILDGSGKLMSLVLLEGAVEALRGSHSVRRCLVPVLLALLFWIFLVASIILGIIQGIREKYPPDRLEEAG